MMTECPAVRAKHDELRELVIQHHAEATSNKDNLDAISKTCESVKEDKISAKTKKKLQNLYKIAIQNTNREADLLCKALNHIKEIRAILNEKRLAAKSSGLTKGLTSKTDYLNMLTHRGKTLPAWIGSVHEDPPPLCGAIPAESSYIAKIGDMVAAFVKVDTENAWALAEVTKYDPLSKRYEVDDICEEMQSYVVHRRQVIPLPLMRPNPETHPQALFLKDVVVLALYPQTSCFYRALVKEPPKELYDDYELLFEDNDCDEGYSSPYQVCQQYVIACKEG